MTRDGNDIRMDLPVTLKEAVLGGKVPVPTLTGTVSLTVPRQFQHRHGAAAEGQGRARPMARHAAGDLYVRLVVTLPDKPDEALTDSARAGRRTMTPAPRCAKHLVTVMRFSPPENARLAAGIFRVND